MRSKQKPVRLSPAAHALLKRLAKLNGHTLSEQVYRLVTAALKGVTR